MCLGKLAIEQGERDCGKIFHNITSSYLLCSREFALVPLVLHRRRFPAFGVLARFSAYKIFRATLQVPQPGCEPTTYSYWLATNLPLHSNIRKTLLGITNTSYRLSILIQILDAVSGFQCRRCWHQVLLWTSFMAEASALSKKQDLCCLCY